MVWCRDQQHASKFFRKSLEVVCDILDDKELVKEERLKDVHHKLVWYNVHRYALNGVRTQVQVSTFAMMASTWDVGLVARAKCNN